MSGKKVNNKPATDDEVMEGEIIEEGAGKSVSSVSRAEYDELAQKLQQSQTQAKDNLDGWQRERADFANYKRRIERDQQTAQQNMTIEIIKKYLAVADDLERALKNQPATGSEAIAWAEGIELILRKLQGILNSEGIERIPAENEEFDPSRHEAISYEESPDHKGEQIIEVVLQGYTLGDRIIRPAKVRVARG